MPVDEFPLIHECFIITREKTIIYKVYKIPAVARKKNVCVFFVVQAYEQLVRDYGIQNAKVIRNSCGNIFNGISSIESAEITSSMIGDHKPNEYSFTSGESGSSIAQSYKTDV